MLHLVSKDDLLNQYPNAGNLPASLSAGECFKPDAHLLIEKKRKSLAIFLLPIWRIIPETDVK
jgi:hypothetical protein